jgi:hypothetical protein
MCHLRDLAYELATNEIGPSLFNQSLVLSPSIVYLSLSLYLYLYLYLYVCVLFFLYFSLGSLSKI